ncbi:MAG: DUF2232 domain-containing protein [Syntrophobacterales bacterium]
MAGSRWLIWSYGLVALSGLILLGRLSPVASLFLSTWLPLPLLAVGWRQGIVDAVLLALAGVLFVFALNPGTAVLLESLGLWMLLLMGLILTVCQNRDWPAGSAILFTVAALGFLFLMFFLGQALFQGLSPLELWGQKAGEFTKSLKNMLQEAGIDFSDLGLVGLPRVEFQELVVKILPALAMVNLALVAWVNVVVVRKLANLWGWSEWGEPLSHWASPEWLVFLLAAAGLAMLAPWPWVRQVGLNLLLIMGFMYFCQGMAVMAGLFERYQVPWFLRGLGYVLAFMNILMIVVMILGLTDLWLDFRKLQKPREA